MQRHGLTVQSVDDYCRIFTESLEDLLKPQYAGKLVIPDASQHTTTAQWMASLHKVMGGNFLRLFEEVWDV